MVSPNHDVELKRQEWSDYSNISSKHYSNKCLIHEKQNMFSRIEKYLVLEKKVHTLCELAAYFTYITGVVLLKPHLSFI